MFLIAWLKEYRTFSDSSVVSLNSLRSWRDSGAGERAAEPPYSLAKPAREFTSDEAASEFPDSTLHQSSHGLATRVHGFSTKTKATAREIPPATQAKLEVLALAKIHPVGNYFPPKNRVPLTNFFSSSNMFFIRLFLANT